MSSPSLVILPLGLAPLGCCASWPWQDQLLQRVLKTKQGCCSLSCPLPDAICQMHGGVVDVALLGGEVLNTSETDSSHQALAADEHPQCPSDNDDLPLPRLERSRPVKSSSAHK